MGTGIRLATILCLLICVTPAGAQSFVKAAANSTVGTATTVTISTTANDAIVVIAYQGVNSTSTLSVSDPASNTYTQAGSYVAVSGDRFAMFYNCHAAAVTSVTATWSGSISATVPVVVFEISGLAASGCLDPHGGNPVSSTQTSGTHSSFPSGTLSTTNSADILVFGMGAGSNLSGEAAGSGFTLPSGGKSSNGRAAMIYKVVAATQTNVSTSITFTSATVQSAGIFAAFSATGGGGPTCAPTLTLGGIGRCG